MAQIDEIRISKTMSYLLRHRPEHGDLTLDKEGWVEMSDLTTAVSKLLRVTIEIERIRVVVSTSDIQRFEIVQERIRATIVPSRRQSGPRLPFVPDILYHATAAENVPGILDVGELNKVKRPLFLSESESQAWRVAHRMKKGTPHLLYVDAARARRHGTNFRRNPRSGLFMADRIAVRDVLNLRENFSVQLSAGGFPLAIDRDGAVRMALIKVTRRSGTTWEVAKGKLEPGESPEVAAVRETQEEMGIDVEMEVMRELPTVRYGFLAPGGLPRLKSIYLYFLRPLQPIEQFVPSTREGIGDVKWFTPDDACKNVRHTSLMPIMRTARDLLRSGAVPLKGLITLS